MRTHEKRNAFSLVELLVVIAIISVLAAMLLPTLQQGLESARLLRCANNQRQILFSATMYADDFGGYTMRPLSLGYKSHIINQWTSPRPAMNLAILIANRYFPTPDILYCPGHPDTPRFLAAARDPLTQLHNLRVYPTFALTNDSNKMTYWMAEPGRYSGTVLIENDPRQPIFQYFWHWNNASGNRLATKWGQNFPGAAHETAYGSLAYPIPEGVSDGKRLRSPRALMWCQQKAHNGFGYNIMFVDGVLRCLTEGADFVTLMNTPTSMDTMRPVVTRSYPRYLAPQ